MHVCTSPLNWQTMVWTLAKRYWKIKHHSGISLDYCQSCNSTPSSKLWLLLSHWCKSCTTPKMSTAHMALNGKTCSEMAEQNPTCFRWFYFSQEAANRRIFWSVAAYVLYVSCRCLLEVWERWMASFPHGRSTFCHSSHTCHTNNTRWKWGLEELTEVAKKLERGWKTVHLLKWKSGLNYLETTLLPNYQVWVIPRATGCTSAALWQKVKLNSSSTLHHIYPQIV